MLERLLHTSLLLALSATVSPLWAQNQDPDPDKPISFEEQVVVSASRSEEQLINAPAAVSLITSETVENSTATNMGDLLRAVPGVNVTQLTARDVNITTRGATSTLSTSQLALVDGRTIYLDFFGMIMWDLVPANPTEIKQIEVVRGPASAVWGANAMSGVVNVITKTPRELAASGGESLTIGVGGFGRNVTGRDASSGSLFYVNGSLARAVDERWSYKVSAGYFGQDAMPRPTGALPSGTPYPGFANSGTSQPKFDARVDYELEDNGGRITLAGGVAGTEGIIHSGIGPFDVSSASRLGYLSARYNKGQRRVAVFTNLLNGDASNLLTVGPNLQPIGLTFDTKTFDIEAADVTPIGRLHVLSFGGNYRHNTFDISLAPAGDSRNEGGAYIQDEIFLGSRARWVVGTRLDKFSSIEGAVLSPRTAFLFKPAPAHTVRASVNRAFRAPSLINNHLDVTVVTPVQLPPPLNRLFAFPTRAVGNEGLEQETLTAFELGYAGVIRNRATVTAAVYWNHTEDAIYFTPVAAYSPENPPPGWTSFAPAAFVPRNVLTSQYTYLNIGTVKDKGIELGVDAAINPFVSVFTNYSYQWMPEVDGLTPGTSINDINWPAKNRFNAGTNVSYGRYVGNFSVHFTDEAYWQDVLDARFAGMTDSFTLVNGAFGVKWMGDRITTSLKLTNIGNQEVQQHIFGDIMRRQVVGEVRFQF
jgi:outer membrane receptor for ferrienterochelin and colicin